MRNMSALFTLALTLSACSGEVIDFGQVAQSGDLNADSRARGVELLSWVFPHDFHPTDIVFSMMMQHCGEGEEECEWIPDAHAHFERDVRMHPVPTSIQSAVNLCWVEDQNGSVIRQSSVLPAGNGEISIHVMGNESHEIDTLTLVCDFNEELPADLHTIGVWVTEVTGYVWDPEERRSTDFTTFGLPHTDEPHRTVYPY
jgi:hypothetical protein